MMKTLTVCVLQVTNQVQLLKLLDLMPKTQSTVMTHEQ